MYNKIGFFCCLLVVLQAWCRTIIDRIAVNIPVIDFQIFDFLEQTTPLDPIDIAKFFIYLYKIILCVQ